MNPRTSGLFIGLMVAATFIAGAIIYPHLPSVVAMHWNATGHVNGTGSRFSGTFVLPIILLILWGVWAVLPRLDPIARGFKGFRHVYDFFWIVLTAFLAYVYALMLYADIGHRVDIPEAMLPGLALLFMVAGLIMPMIKRNWFFGIRTPWTLSSENVWDKTHKLGGSLFFIAGVLILAGGLVPRACLVWVIVVPIAVAAIVSIVYSYILYERERVN